MNTIQLNLTLIVQAINFWITYFVLHRYIFAPVIKRIRQRKNDEKKLRSEIILKQKDVSNFLEEKVMQLAQFQKDAKLDYPFYYTHPKKIDLPEQPKDLPEIDEKEKIALKKKLIQRTLDVE